MHTAHCVCDCKTPIRPVSVSPQWISLWESQNEIEREGDADR